MSAAASEASAAAVAVAAAVEEADEKDPDLDPPPARRRCDGELHAACRVGDLDRVRYLVQVARRDINEADEHDSPPLYYAALCGHEGVCRFLLESGARCSEDARDAARIYYAALTDGLRRMLQEYDLSAAAEDPFLDLIRRAYDGEEFADAEVVLPSGRVIMVHRAMLSVRCPALAPSLVESGGGTGGGGGSGRMRVRLPPLPHGRDCSDEDEDALEAVCEYLYTGRLETRSPDLAERAAAVAGAFGLDGLSRDLEGRLEADGPDGDGGIGGGGGPRGRIVVDRVGRLRADMAALGRCVVPSPSLDGAGRLDRPPPPRPPGPARDLVRSSSDVSLSAEAGPTLAAHRFVVCAQSDYFRGALLGPFSEARDGRITLTGVSPEAVAAACEWMYSDGWGGGGGDGGGDGGGGPDPDLCAELLGVSSMLLLPRMAALAGTVLAQHVDADSAVDVLRASRAHGLPKLEESCLRALALRIEEVAREPERWGELLGVVREEVAETAQRGDANVADVPIVADMRKVLTDHYAYLDDYYSDDDDDNDNGEPVAGESDPKDAESKMEEKVVHGRDKLDLGRGLRKERRDKLMLLDRLVQEALEGNQTNL